MAKQSDILEHFDRLIANKREQIATYAADLATDLQRLAKRAGDGGHVGECPIQHSATVINTFCGELNALVDARKMAAVITVS